MMRYIPNILTILRIVLTPYFLYILFWGNGDRYAWALLIFITAGITDIIDGQLARKFQVESKMGKLLDPLADKILVISAFISFVTLNIISAWMVALIILRDVVITIIRYMLEKSDMPMATSKLAKAKTGIQVGIIIAILLYQSLKSYQFYWLTNPVDNLYLIPIFMFITVAVTIYTGIDYYRVNRASIKALGE